MRVMSQRPGRAGRWCHNECRWPPDTKHSVEGAYKAGLCRGLERGRGLGGMVRPRGMGETGRGATSTAGGVEGASKREARRRVRQGEDGDNIHKKSI